VTNGGSGGPLAGAGAAVDGGRASSEIALDSAVVSRSLAAAGQVPQLREALFEALREAEANALDPGDFREQVRWPIVLSLLGGSDTHRVTLDGGLVFEVSPASRIEKALLLSSRPHPDHVWEPQTTKLLVALAHGAANVVVGGAYIGDHVLPIAKAVAPGGRVHAFEPMAAAFDRLVRNLGLNGLANVVARRQALWDASGVPLRLDGPLALASTVEVDTPALEPGGSVPSITVDDYLDSCGVRSAKLIMLDTEGGEERALRGSRRLLEQPPGQAPNVVFEIHRHFVDWSEGLEHTSVARLLAGFGYTLYAVRDLHGNHPMDGYPIEVVPVERVYLDGPPHGFNVLATKDSTLVDRLGLEVVADVSPKLIIDHDPALHHPVKRPALSRV